MEGPFWDDSVRLRVPEKKKSWIPASAGMTSIKKLARWHLFQRNKLIRKIKLATSSLKPETRNPKLFIFYLRRLAGRSGWRSFSVPPDSPPTRSFSPSPSWTGSLSHTAGIYPLPLSHVRGFPGVPLASSTVLVNSLPSFRMTFTVVDGFPEFSMVFRSGRMEKVTFLITS